VKKAFSFLLRLSGLTKTCFVLVETWIRLARSILVLVAGICVGYPGHLDGRVELASD
jgi:hypothetical protein